MSLALRNTVNISTEHASSLSNSLSPVTSQGTAVVKQCLPKANLGTGVDFKREAEKSSPLPCRSPQRGGSVEAKAAGRRHEERRPLLDLPAAAGP